MLSELTRKIRKKLGLTQEQFARELQATGSSVGNWEAGRKRPAPRFLRAMTQLVPEFAEEIRRELEKFTWHPQRVASVATLAVPADLLTVAEVIGKREGLDTDDILVQALRAGLAAMSRAAAAGLDLQMSNEANERGFPGKRARAKQSHSSKDTKKRVS